MKFTLPLMVLITAALLSGCSDDGGTPTPPETGTVVVTISPDGLVVSWTLNGPDAFIASGRRDTVLTERAVGDYTMTWGELPGYFEPPIAAQNLSAGETVTFQGTYVLDPTATGSVAIDVSPDVLHPSWVLKILTGGGLHDAAGMGDATIDDLPPGPLTVDWQPIPDFIEPHGGQFDYELASAEELTVSGAYTPRPPLDIQMVRVEAGTFVMGSPEWELGYAPPFDTPIRPDEEAPQHEVTLTRALLVSAYEITQGQYLGVVGSNPSTFDGTVNRPVETVSWLQACQFCNALSASEGLDLAYDIVGAAVGWNQNAEGYRMPTEAEWEYLCRGERPEAFAHGPITVLGEGQNPESDPVLERLGWYWSNSGGPFIGSTMPVGSKLPNAYGLFDMHGNVAEWCWDRYDATYYAASPETDPAGPAVGNRRVLRGGSYASYANGCRSASRVGLDPSVGVGSVGIRVVRWAETVSAEKPRDVK